MLQGAGTDSNLDLFVFAVGFATVTCKLIVQCTIWLIHHQFDPFLKYWKIRSIVFSGDVFLLQYCSLFNSFQSSDNSGRNRETNVSAYLKVKLFLYDIKAHVKAPFSPVPVRRRTCAQEICMCVCERLSSLLVAALVQLSTTVADQFPKGENFKTIDGKLEHNLIVSKQERV